MSNHTPDPWKLDETWMLIVGQDGAEVCAIHSGQSDGAIRVDRNIAHANAELIAAAPETKRQRDVLLKACRQTLAWFESFDGDGHTHGDGVPSAWLRSTIALCEKEGV
jgi:hypothetical protein